MIFGLPVGEKEGQLGETKKLLEIDFSGALCPHFGHNCALPVVQLMHKQDDPLLKTVQ